MSSAPISPGGMTRPHLFKTTRVRRLPVPPSSTNLLLGYCEIEGKISRGGISQTDYPFV